MKGKKKIIALVASLSILGAAGSVYAADGEFKTPAEIVAGLTGKTVTEITAEREPGTTYGTIANDAGVLDQFKSEMIEQKKAVLDQRVKDGDMTQEQADAFIERIETNQATCDGTGSARMGQANGARFGQGMMGQGRGAGAGLGSGRGMGQGAGMGYGYTQGNAQ